MEKRIVNTRMRLAIISAVLVVVVAAVSLYIYLQTESMEQSSDSNLKDLMYDESILGYNSTSWGSVSVPTSLPKDVPLPDTANLSLVIYHYATIDITDSDEYGDVIEKNFPEINISKMDVTTEYDPDYQMPYLTISDDDIELRVLRSGALVYRDKAGPLRKSDEIKSEENATKIAYQFLKNHGGVPDDIRNTDVIPLYVIPDEGPIFFGQYLVKFQRDIANYSVISSSLCNEISIYIDASNEKVIEYEWHWPDLNEAMALDQLPEAKEIIEFYGMANKGSSNLNITAAQICYFVPSNIHESAYDTRRDDYYLAPYLVISVENGQYYILGLEVPEEVK